MPEAYTHIRTGRRALSAAGMQIPCPAAFALGCQGPDLLFAYLLPSPKLPALGNRMHAEHTGAFLRALVRLAKGPAQTSYAMGFLCHYGTDTVLHPYVGALTAPGAVYGMEGGHGYFEAALDSCLHAAETGSAAVPAAHSCPPVPAHEMQAIARLLVQAIEEAYGERCAPVCFVRAYRHTRLVRVLFCSRFGVKKGIFALAERAGLAKTGYLTGHVTPAKLADALPAVWAHTVTGEVFRKDVDTLLEEAEANCVRLVQVYREFTAGALPADQLHTAIGSLSYDTGLAVD